MPSHSFGRRRSGLSYVEVLMASVVCVVCLSILIQLWSFSLMLTMQTTDNAVACDLARQTVETLKETGFSQTPEAPSSAPLVHYYNVDTLNLDSTPTAARYKVTTTVVSDAVVAGSNPVTPVGSALRQVTTTVTLVQSGTTLTTLTTYLAREGI
jgi:Tfp pilus assembly protein PilV